MCKHLKQVFNDVFDLYFSHLFQYFLNTPDAEGEQFLKWFTFVPDDDIERLCRDHKVRILLPNFIFHQSPVTKLYLRGSKSTCQH